MKKIIANIMTIAMVSGLACGVTACGDLGTKVVENIDKNKTQLYIGSYNGGAGYKWLDEAATRFEKMYETKSFEDDKTGVQVIIDHSKSYTAGNFGNENDIVFSNNTAYFDVANPQDLMPITDVVTEINPHDSKSIESKLGDSAKSALKVNGEYYALPYFEYYSSVSYDADLFNNNKLYFSNQLDANNTTYPGTNAFVTTKNATNLSCGPDAVYGTYDDGLPSTYQEFYKLMERMISGDSGEKITPFAFRNSHYSNNLMNALAANYVGADGWRTNFEFDSNGKEVEIVTGFKDGVPEVTKEVLTQENAYKIKSSLGLYYAAEFCQKVFSNSQYYDRTAASESSSNIAVQEYFVRSGWDNATPTPIAMLIEGSYWYNEAEQEGIFDRVRKYDPAGNNGIKNIKFMPLPHQYAGTVTPKENAEEALSPVLVNAGNSYAFIDSVISNESLEVAKLFLSFCYSDDELEKAELSNNGVAKRVNYSALNIKDELSTYARSLNDARNQAAANGSIVENIASNEIFKKNESIFTLSTNSAYWTSTIDIDYAHVFTAYSSNCSAQQYFKGLEITEAVWKTNYLKIN